MKVKNGTVVFIRYRMKNSKGEVLENKMNGPAISYLHGGGYILPALEAELEGLSAGEEKIVRISEKKGYDGMDDEYYIEVIIDYVHLATDAELIEGVNLLQAYSTNCGANCGCYKLKYELN